MVDVFAQLLTIGFSGRVGFLRADVSDETNGQGVFDSFPVLCLVKTFRMLGKIRFAAIISLDSSSVLILRMTAPYHDGRKSGKDNILR